MPEAVGVLKSFPPTKFDQTIEIHMRLGIDPKQAEIKAWEATYDLNTTSPPSAAMGWR